MSIEDDLIKIGGNLELSILTYKDASRMLYLLVQNKKQPVIALGLLLQYKNKNGNTAIYIEALDTTGYFEPRNKQTIFTKNFVISIIKSIDTNFLCCFSHPKNELIFGKSEANIEKGNLSPRRLMRYWIDIFKKAYDGKLDIISNFYPTMSFPKRYKALESLYLFEDDPKKKLLDDTDGEISVNELFSILAHRKDFIKGSLIYYTTDAKNDVKIVDCKHDEDLDLSYKISFLRNANFSTRKNATESTQAFLSTFRCTMNWFTTNNNELETEEKKEIKCVRLIPRKK